MPHLHLLVICDAEKESGLGHYTRTQAVLSELENFGHRIIWLFPQKIPDYIFQEIEKKKQSIEFYDCFDNINYYIKQIYFDHIFIDSYIISEKIRLDLRNTYKLSKIISIQDAPPYLYSDIYINHNLTHLKSDEYNNSDSSLLLSGEKFMMVDFKKYVRKHECNQQQIKKVLIFFGGTSQLGLIKTSLQALSKLNAHLQINVFTIESDVEIIENSIKQYVSGDEIQIYPISAADK
ncbi:hypothetical protein N9353_03415 [Amylibacter sp.]|nr:hypothetical protein [Amylibacter sp.]